MGGPGSGGWYRWNKKLTVDDGLSLDINKLVRDGLILRQIAMGSLKWTNTRTGEETASVGFFLNPVGEDGLIMRLKYSRTDRDGDKEEFDYPIMLQITRPHYGGRRWWFTCPLAGCGRRVGKLYLPPGGKYFGCRHCYDLTYTSCQESDKRVSRYLRNYDGFGGVENMPLWAVKGFLSRAWKEEKRLEKEIARQKKRRRRPPKGKPSSS